MDLVVPRLVESLESAANAIKLVDELDIDDVDGADDGADDDDKDTSKLLEVNSAIAVEQEIEADTIGTLFAATGRHFPPFAEQCALELVGLLPRTMRGSGRARRRVCWRLCGAFIG